MRAILMGLLAGAAVLTAPGAEPEYSHHLTTLNGRTYDGVRLIKVDPNGLLFRHRDGVAKVTFDNLDDGYREYYGFDPVRAKAFETAHSTRNGNSPKKEKAGDAGIPAADEIVLTYRVRTVVRLPIGHFARGQSVCGRGPWFSHWARYHPGLSYARFPCRQRAERDFLISSGILPVPPGVVVRRLR